VRVLGHRGARLDAPENTLASFQAALDQGADGVELDVRRSADGTLVCLHDADLERTTDASGPVGRRTVAELRAVDAGSRFERDGTFPFRGAGVRVPTLAEALAAVPAPGLVDIEVKAGGGRAVHPEHEEELLAEALRAELDGRPDRARLLVSTFSRRLAALLAPAVAPVPVALVTTTLVPLGRALRAARSAGCAALAAQAPAYLAPGARAAAARAVADGVLLMAWTVDDPGLAARLEGLGVSVLISDRPGALRAGAAGRAGREQHPPGAGQDGHR